jgi:4-amino-4-deoxy-L-arabinose transferase-like glycosyltransferase
MSEEAGSTQIVSQYGILKIRENPVFPWIVFAGILVLYFILLARIHPTNFFGQMEDDAIYFSSARELARGHGYVMPNLPGNPAVTKYPILYPWLLSWVWRLNPNFPANLSWAAVINVSFGAGFLTAAFVFLRRLNGVSVTAALGLTAFCAVHPVVLALSSELMSDIPFATFILTACILASKAAERDSGYKSALLSGLFCGLAILTRTLGVPVALGLFLGTGIRRGWRKAMAFAASATPFFAVLVGRALMIKAATEPAASGPCAHSWQMTWLYYTSYTDYWKADVVENHVVWPILKNGIWATLSQPGSYFVDPTGVKPAIIAVVLLVFLSAIAIRGLFRQMQVGGAQPVHYALLFCVLPVMVWDYAPVERFLIPFLPLIVAGTWIEAQHLISMVRTAIRKQSGAEATFAAVFFCLLACALLVGGVVSWAKGSYALLRDSRLRGALLEEKSQAYAWLRQNAQPRARVLAYEDASVFLSTGRQAIRPIIFSPAGYYRPEILDTEISCLMASSQPTKASYWVVSEDDFSVEWEPAHSRAHAQEKELEVKLKPLFRSSRGNVRIYGLEPDVRR